VRAKTNGFFASWSNSLPTYLSAADVLNTHDFSVLPLPNLEKIKGNDDRLHLYGNT
jgi:hypothetical protein